MLYQRDITSYELGHIYDILQQTHEGTYSDEVWKYARKLAGGIVQQLEQIDAHIVEHSENWDFQRVCVIDKNILRIAIYEMLFSEEEIPPKVCINEAIEISKRYSSSMSAGFINGILDQINKKLLTNKGTAN